MKYYITHKYEVDIEKLFKMSEAANIHLRKACCDFRYDMAH